MKREDWTCRLEIAKCRVKIACDETTYSRRHITTEVRALGRSARWTRQTTPLPSHSVHLVFWKLTWSRTGEGAIKGLAQALAFLRFLTSIHCLHSLSTAHATIAGVLMRVGPPSPNGWTGITCPTLKNICIIDSDFYLEFKKKKCRDCKSQFGLRKKNDHNVWRRFRNVSSKQSLSHQVGRRLTIVRELPLTQIVKTVWHARHADFSSVE